MERVLGSCLMPSKTLGRNDIGPSLWKARQSSLAFSWLRLLDGPSFRVSLSEFPSLPRST